MNLLSLASHELRRAADLVDKIEDLKNELSSVLGSSSSPLKGKRKKHTMSDAGRLAIAAAQKARWAKAKVKSAVKRTMSPAARAKIARAAKARWAKAKATGKKSF